MNLTYKRDLRPYSKRDTNVYKDVFFKERYFLVVPLYNIIRLILWQIIFRNFCLRVSDLFFDRLYFTKWYLLQDLVRRDTLRNNLRQLFMFIVGTVYFVKFLCPIVPAGSFYQRDQSKETYVRNLVFMTFYIGLRTFFFAYWANEITGDLQILLNGMLFCTYFLSSELSENDHYRTVFYSYMALGRLFGKHKTSWMIVPFQKVVVSSPQVGVCILIYTFFNPKLVDSITGYLGLFFVSIMIQAFVGRIKSPNMTNLAQGLLGTLKGVNLLISVVLVALSLCICTRIAAYLFEKITYGLIRATNSFPASMNPGQQEKSFGYYDVAYLNATFFELFNYGIMALFTLYLSPKTLFQQVAVWALEKPKGLRYFGFFLCSAYLLGTFQNIVESYLMNLYYYYYIEIQGREDRFIVTKQDKLQVLRALQTERYCTFICRSFLLSVLQFIWFSKHGLGLGTTLVTFGGLALIFVMTQFYVYYVTVHQVELESKEKSFEMKIWADSPLVQPSQRP